ncbi:MAG: putative outer rane lipoprotein [Prosthecobacter sp.]|nr:putative outer rane lipoprotein [Prosthecobacter sp.]
MRLENRTKKRIEIVLSVDGLNVLNGKAASPKQRGFILEPKETYEVDGFRKDDTTARSFVFGSVSRSKAAAKGAAGNVGVIGLAVFEEDEVRAKAELQREQLARQNANAFPVSR